MVIQNKQPRICSTAGMVNYSVGEIANSLIMNSLFGFAMLYYTDALGLKHSMAGIAMFLATFWDAVTDPVMGHISDNTKSRFGRRHPYLVIGGLGMLASFIFLWYVPEAFKASTHSLFWYLLVMNIFLRTAITIFGVPFTALGFEICTDYDGRVKLQGIRNASGMLANVLGPGMAWTIFFSNNELTRATSVENNYIKMGSVFALVSAFAIIYLILVTKKYIINSTDIKTDGNNLKGFFRDMKEIITDRYPRFVFAYIMIVVLGIALVSALQMYLYEHFMKFEGWEKSIAHGGTMLASMLGGLSASIFTSKLDKKGTVFFGGILSVVSNFILAVVFLPGLLEPGQEITFASFNIPVAFIVFVIPHALYWYGNGIMLPVATSMMADVSEINEIKTGINKDGAYAAVFSFAFKCAISLGVLISGYTLDFVGFVEGKGVVQSEQTIINLCAATLIVGPVISLTALVLIKFYPVTANLLEQMRENRLADK